MTDALDQEIEQKRKALAAMDDARYKLDIELTALLRAAKLRPVSAPAVAISPSPHEHLPQERKGGKPPGAISPKWRDVLSDVYREGGKKKYFEYFEHASRREISTNMTAVRDRVRAWEKMGFLAGDPETGFEVTDSAAQRFGFKSSAPGDNLFDEAPPASELAGGT